MSEKVLGFKQKEGVYHKEDFQWKVYEDDLVLVNLKSESVTLEWLEKYCNEKQFIDWNGKCSCGKEFTISHPDKLKYLQVSDLLLAAKKESEKKE